ncbi:MAG: TonB-dependent receptor [Methylobacter sp.]|nr:MAG: TonB-dependent receptor [Methylobacter sp.]
MPRLNHFSSRFTFLLGLLASTQTFAADSEKVLNLSVEELLNVKVTSVSKKAQALNDAAAAVFVISNEDIKRAGATTIPDALRLAPGLDVAKIDANKWAVSARGFNGRFANKLLVLIDGRNAYTRTFAGVYWEAQDVLMEDIDRIEVIRGPGGTLWGANAVNGVINIITKHTSNTQGGLVAAGGGDQEQGFGGFRYGGKLAEDTTGRVYVKGFKREQNSYSNGQPSGDQWDKVQGGFRVDSRLNAQDELTVQGDLYQANINQNVVIPQLSQPFSSLVNDKAFANGGNLLSKWQRTLSPTSSYTLQAYYDYYNRDDAVIKEARNTLDLDFQHRFALADRHDFIWGLGYQYSLDNVLSSPVFQVDPKSRGTQLFSSFIQDEIAVIRDTLWFTIGSKFEHNDFSGFELQPSARFLWAPHSQHRFWASVSRAVRTPSRGEENFTTLVNVTRPQQTQAGFIPPVAAFVNNSPAFSTEHLLAYELGYRTTAIDSVSLDLTLFYNNYDSVRSVSQVGLTPGFPIVVNSELTNEYSPKTYGAEVAVVWQMLDWWRWDANYSYLRTDLSGAPFNQLAVSPQQRFSLRSSLSPWRNIDFDAWLRYVDPNSTISSTGAVTIPAYTTLDLRVAWRPEVKGLELSVTGQNLLEDRHLEYLQESFTLPTAVNRGVYGKIAWEF